MIRSCKKGKGQNVKNHFVESLKKEHWKSKSWLIDQNVESIFLIDQNVERSERWKSLRRKSKKEHRKSNLSDFQIVNYLWRKYLWRFGVKNQS